MPILATESQTPAKMKGEVVHLATMYECQGCGDYVEGYPDWDDELEGYTPHVCPGVPNPLGKVVLAVKASKRKVAFLRKEFKKLYGYEPVEVEGGTGYILFTLEPEKK